jgi:hypothetical protein
VWSENSGACAEKGEKERPVSKLTNIGGPVMVGMRLIYSSVN